MHAAASLTHCSACCHAACRSSSGPLVVDWDAAELCLDLLLVVLLRNRDRLPLLWPPVFDHLASIIKGKGVSCCSVWWGRGCAATDRACRVSPPACLCGTYVWAARWAVMRHICDDCWPDRHTRAEGWCCLRLRSSSSCEDASGVQRQCLHTAQWGALHSHDWCLGSVCHGPLPHVGSGILNLEAKPRADGGLRRKHH